MASMFWHRLLRTSISAALLSLAAALPAQQLINGYEPKWWKEAVVYQIYPRSFKDSNGDGIGDLPGITSKLDYLQKLGVNVIWLSPHFDSPNADNGYDIRDYRKVMTEFGTMSDFDTLLAGIKQRHMRLIIDLVVNHTSDEHKWFVESRSSKTNPYRDFYIWRPGHTAPDGTRTPPNNYPSYFSGSAWTLDPKTNEYYLHYFAAKQPDLNWANPKVREEVYSLMRFWLDKGVSGFRMDVIPLISKPTGMPDLTARAAQSAAQRLRQRPPPRRIPPRDESRSPLEVRRHVRRRSHRHHPRADQRPRRRPPPRAQHDLQLRRHQARPLRLRPQPTRRLVPARTQSHLRRTTPRVLTKHDWDTVFLSNHDNPRIVSTFGDDSPAMRASSAKLFETMILTLRGTPFLFEGDELGMTNYPFKKLVGLRRHRRQERLQGRGRDRQDLRRSLPRIAGKGQPRQRPHPHAVG